MSLLYLPPVNLVGTTSLVDIMSAVPTGQVETMNLRASLISGAVEAYADVYLENTSTTNDGMLYFQEPIKYRTAGGSPDLLIGFVLTENFKLQVRASAGATINFCLYNRIRKPAAYS